MAVYTGAGRREGLNVRAAYIHDLKAANRESVDVSPGTIAATEQAEADTVHRLRNWDFTARPSRPCKPCDVRKLCPWKRTSRLPSGQSPARPGIEAPTDAGTAFEVNDE